MESENTWQYVFLFVFFQLILMEIVKTDKIAYLVFQTRQEGGKICYSNVNLLTRLCP